MLAMVTMRDEKFQLHMRRKLCVRCTALGVASKQCPCHAWHTQVRVKLSTFWGAICMKTLENVLPYSTTWFMVTRLPIEVQALTS